MGLNIDSPWLSSEQGCRERILHELKNGWYLTVAWENDQVMGLLAIKPAEGVLDQLSVSPAAKGRGIGTELLPLVMVKMPGGFWLRTAEANGIACSFYEAQGLMRDRIEARPSLGHATVVYVWP